MGSIRIEVSPELRAAVQAACKGAQEVPEGVSSIANGSEDCLGVDDMRWVQERLPSGVYLHELLLGCEVKLPGLEVAPRDPQLEARVQRLRAEQAAREYRAMTRNVDGTTPHYPEDSIAYQMKQINRQLIAVFQFVVSVAAGFTFGFLGIELILGDLEFGFRLLLGVMCALIIALAEIYFLAKKLSEDLPPPSISHVSAKPHAD